MKLVPGEADKILESVFRRNILTDKDKTTVSTMFRSIIKMSRDRAGPQDVLQFRKENISSALLVSGIDTERRTILKIVQGEEIDVG